MLNGKAPHHKVDTFTHINSLLYKHAMDATKTFLALVIPKSWHFTVFTEAHDTWQYYWKGLNKDICKYIANCTLCKREKTKMQIYPVQIMDILD